MKYPAVPHSHIAPVGYLKAWRSGKRIRAHREEEPGGRAIGARDAAVRSNFYRRERPSGETIYDIEWTLQRVEDVAIPVLDAVRERRAWPLTGEEKHKLAQLLALQVLRVPAFREWHAEFVSKQAAKIRGSEDDPAPGGLTAAEAAAAFEEHYKSDTQRTIRMLELSQTVAEILGSMHWTLVAFSKPVLGTSDQPVVVWPLGRSSARPGPNDLNIGMTETLEAFVALSPSLLLLMTWLAEADREDIAAGSGRHAATANAFTIANADQQWFSHPDHPTISPARGPRPPLSSEILPAYTAATAEKSVLRSAVAKRARDKVGRPLGDEEVSIIRIGEKPG